MKQLEITLGSDPELVIVDERARPVSALRILKTTKDNPIDLGDSIRIYADNVLVEAAFDPVGPEDIVTHIGNVLQRMAKAVAPYAIMPKAATHFSMRELRNRTAWLAGCNANHDAYREGGKNKIVAFTDGMRTGSFHIHIGNKDWKKGEDPRLMNPESKLEAIKLLDLYVGLASVVFDKDPTAGLRRKLYGKAGEFRPTPYGVEYRVLGNYALRSRSCVQLVFDLVQIAMDRISDGTGLDAMRLIPEKEIVNIINNNDCASAIDAVHNIDLDKSITDRIMNEEYVPEGAMKLGWGF